MITFNNFNQTKWISSTVWTHNFEEESGSRSLPLVRFHQKRGMCGGIFLDMKWSSQLSWGGRGSYSISFSQPYAIVRLHFMNFKFSILGNIRWYKSRIKFRLKIDWRLKKIMESFGKVHINRTFCPEVKLGDYWSLPHL